jgi:hypothetical protein
VKGFDRCRHHIGGADAKRFRQLKQKRFEQGKLTPQQMRNYAARRARNRLNAIWRRDPWVPGQTIDLGEHEADFRLELAYSGCDISELAPALADKARWKWRRFRLDGQSADKWHEFVSRDLPQQITKAGPRPADYDARLPAVNIEPVKAAPAGPSSRRRNSDRPRRQKPAGISAKRQRGRPRKALSLQLDEQTTAQLIAQNAELRTALAMSKSDDEARKTIAAFHGLLLAPGDAVAAIEWQRRLIALRAGAHS